MHYKKMIIAVFCFSISGCAGMSPSSDTSSAAAGGQCSRAELTFHVGNSYLWVTPRNKCVRQGELVPARIKVHGTDFKLEANKVRIDSTTAWLDGNENSNPSRPEWITFTVDPAATPNQNYKYDLIVQDVGRLDPVVHVE